MRVLFFGNNRAGLKILRYLINRDDDIVGVVVHPPERSQMRDEILNTAGLPADRVFSGNTLRQRNVLDSIRATRAEIGVSVLFDYILKKELLDLFPAGVVNLHPSFLPYNRGQYPNVWSIVDQTPAGATIHIVDPGIDTGDIIAQRRVEVEPIDTGASLYAKLETCCSELFVSVWPTIASGRATGTSQNDLQGTSHRRGDVDLIDRIDLNRPYTARELINILRARTFPPYRGAYFVDNGRRVGLRLELEYEDDES